ncbi:MAG: DMT family transporter [Armatimonadota bacterium]|nr:DMT family transporter [Armatimonadota bacterium]MDR5696307.1 DMT family transporter [Armatimonadota bacterium]
MPPSPITRRLVADASLLLVAAVWGATFPLAKAILQHVPPFAYLGARFALAAALLLPFAAGALRRAGAPAWRRGLWSGAALGGGYALQTLGLRLTTATTAAFITGLSVVLVPVLGTMWGRRPGPREWTGVALAAAGLAMLTLDGASWPGVGELLVLGCAACFALHILLLDRASARTPPLALGAMQMLAAAAVCGLLVPTEPLPSAVPVEIWGAVAGMAVVASAGAFSIQAWAQRFTPPTHVGLVFASEPVAAALFARWWLREVLDGVQWIGAALILVGIVVAEMRAPTRAWTAAAIDRRLSTAD